MSRSSVRVLRRACLALLIVALPLPSQARDERHLDLDRIFASREFSAEAPPQTAWLRDGTSYTTLEPNAANGANGANGAGKDIVRHDARTGAHAVLVPASALVPAGAREPLDIEDYSWSTDERRLLIFTNSARVWRDNTRGDYWVFDRATTTLRKLGGDAPPSTLMFAKFSPDGERVAYVRQNDLYVERVANHVAGQVAGQVTEQVTDGRITRLTSDGSRTIINGTTDWVYEEELALRDAFRWSPDGTRIAYWQLDASGVRDFLMINNTDSLYSFTIPVQYPKAGTTNSAVRVGVVAADGGVTRWFHVDGDPRLIYLARMEWAANSDEVVIQRLNRLQNTLDLLLGDARTGSVKTLLTDRDSAWVDVVDDMRWFDRGTRFTWVSERDGWRHLFVVSRNGGTQQLVTPGSYDVISVARIDTVGRTIYFIASPENRGQRYLYRVGIDGKTPAQRLTPLSATGWHSYDVSPSGRFAIHTVSTFGDPPVTDLVSLPSHTRRRTFAANDTLRSRLAALSKGSTEFFRIETADGVELDGYLMKPADFDPQKKYPVLFTVYGEPAGQTVTDRFGGRGYLWHLMLTQQGYIVASLDNRGTPAPRGRAWRKSVYRQIGRLTSSDQAAGVKALLATRPYLDASRVGVWGWSGGGSSTLNLMFRYPDLYRVGLAVAPVPDMRNYDTIYQERYMGLPQDNAEDYRLGSPITFASQLKGKLLLVHGSGDDNVHYQGSEQLVNALVAARRPFSLMVYPNRSHGIFEGAGTTTHLYDLLTRYLMENLPAGPRPITLIP